MKTPEKHVKIFAGLIFNRSADIDAVERRLEKEYSAIDYRSSVIDFDFTGYYQKEMGTPLFRKFLSFRDLVDPELLAELKTAAVSMESEFAGFSKKRTVNIDPGYIEPAKVVLASTKNFYHRIYLSSGIYGEVTLSWSAEKGGYRSFEWTFPDFRTDRYKRILADIRGIYMEQRRCR